MAADAWCGRGAVAATMSQWGFPPLASRRCPRLGRSDPLRFLLDTVIDWIHASYRHMAVGAHYPVG
jgi:hypothetical protein